jgi:autotransporter-associated beta strand protein
MFGMGLLAASPATAQNAMWDLTPLSGDFNSNANWTPSTVPTGTAGFGASSTTNLSINANTTVGGFTFNAGAPPYLFTVWPGAGLTFNGAGVVSNSANAPAITNNAGAALNFFDGSTAGSATITNFGSLLFLSRSTAGGATIANNNSLQFSQATTAGSATITNHAVLQFFNISTAGSAGITNNLILEFFDTSTAGSASITNNSGLFFRDTSTAGSAAITNGAAATTDFSLSTGPNNGHKLSAGSIAGGGTFSLGQNQLTVGGNNLSTTVTGIIADGGLGGGTGGSMVKTGTGTLTLDGINTYTGATTINGGTLSVNGTTALSSLTTVNAGGTLAGTGTVGNTSVNGGVFAPGNGAPCTSMAVTGALGFTAASTYAVNVNPAMASSANVSGMATLGAATVKAVFAPGSYISKQYTILTAGSVSGSFGALINTNLPSNFNDTLSYDTTHAYLNLKLNFSVPSGLNGNPQNVGNALTNFFNATGGIPLVFGALTRAGLTQASGEVATGSQQTTFDAMGLFMGLLTDPFVAGRGDGAAGGAAATPFADEGSANAYADNGKPRSKDERDAYAAVYRKAPMADLLAQRWSVWAAGFGGSQTTNGNATLSSNTATSRIYGAAVGADYRFSPFTLAGFALAGGGTNFSVANGGTGRSDLFQAGAFIRHNVGPAYISGALAYGWQDITTDRVITIAGGRSAACRVQRQCALRPGRGRLSLRDAVDERPRHYSLRRRTVHHPRSPRLRRTGFVGCEHIRARLRLEERDRHAQRTGRSHRQILGHAECDPYPARPRRVGA